MLDAGKIMARDRLNRLLVTDEDGDLCGIVSSTDVVFVLLGGCTGERSVRLPLLLMQLLLCCCSRRPNPSPSVRRRR